MTMAMELIRHIAGLYSGKAIKGDFTQVYITGNEIWMAQQVLAEQAEGAQGERERFEAWWNDPAQWELRKSCAMGWGEKIWRAAQGALARQVPEWSSAKPTVEGAYWVRGNGLNEPAVILVKLDQGELWCNLHMNNTETDFGYGYTIAQLSSEFEWFGPLAAAPVAQAGQVPEGYMLITQDQVERHATTAWECPPQSRVVLVSTLKRLHEKNSAAPQPAGGE